MTDAAIPGGRLGWQWPARPFGVLADCLAAEGDRRLLWLPVFFGTGIGLYFALTVEPPLWPGIVAAIAGIGLVLALRRHGGWCEAALALTAVAAGFALMRETAWEHQAPMLQRHLGSIAVTGRVVDIDQMEKGWRIIIDADPLPGLDATEQPRRLRVHIPAKSDELNPGDRVSLKAMLYPVPAQVVPGGRDFQRELYFVGIGGVGYTFGAARRIAEPEGAETEGGWREGLRRLRTEMSRRIVAVLPGATGGVASALITGKRGAIPEEVKQDFRDSGLSHLLSIAGLHLGLVGAFVFFTVRGALALIPPLAVRYPIKKIAAGVALVVLTCYLLLSGAAIPTERAFVMNGLLFVAIIVDRLRISMRVCAIAALVVLVIDPASLIGVSFQMSFGAVVALIAVYETYGAQLGRLLHNRSVLGQLLGYCCGVIVTTVVATLGTCAFSIYHFHSLALYSSLANVIAVPLSAMWTLPWGVVSCLLMPFGLERFGLTPMGWGIDTTIWVARHVSALPGDVWAMPRLPPAGLLMITFGGLWLCLWRGPWRRWGLAAVVAGFATMLLTRPPDIVIADGGRFVAARAPDGRYFVSADKNEKIVRSLFVSETGAALAPWPAAGSGAGNGLDCAGDLCRYTARSRYVAVVTGTAALPLKCAGVDAIVSQVPAGFRCRSFVPVIDRIDSWRRGAVALWLDQDGVAIESANESRGDRPWVPHPRPKPPPPDPAEIPPRS
ncbi:MAG TPA: ComEC/Rec2 family competence protein [Xanthobacteraceae bacterium]|jgi:competence protein ComEC|nr:ComEC/Rec2 family competence protein [Xanthobacteraceae bacterium]